MSLRFFAFTSSYFLFFSFLFFSFLFFHPHFSLYFSSSFLFLFLFTFRPSHSQSFSFQFIVENWSSFPSFVFFPSFFPFFPSFYTFLSFFGISLSLPKFLFLFLNSSIPSHEVTPSHFSLWTILSHRESKLPMLPMLVSYSINIWRHAIRVKSPFQHDILSTLTKLLPFPFSLFPFPVSSFFFFLFPFLSPLSPLPSSLSPLSFYL